LNVQGSKEIMYQSKAVNDTFDMRQSASLSKNRKKKEIEEI
jgi:hypothetical protein